MKYNNFLQELKLLNPNMYVRVAAGFGDRSGFNSDEYAFSNVEMIIILDECYGLIDKKFDLDFRVIDSNYSNKVLTVGEVISSLNAYSDFDIERFTISAELGLNEFWPYFDIFTPGRCQIKTKVIDDDLVEIYLDGLS